MTWLDQAITAIMEEHERYLIEGKFWGGSVQHIIAYGSYTYTTRSGTTDEWHIVGLAQQRAGISVYVNAVEDGKYLTEAYAGRLGKAKVGKSVISFKRLEDIDLDVLLELIAHARDIMARPSTTGS